mgnify:CR=1 FL=1|jgi:hypothetical protein
MTRIGRRDMMRSGAGAMAALLGISPLRARTAAMRNALPLTDNGSLDVRTLIGGDGDISQALLVARNANLNIWLSRGDYVLTGAFDQRDMRIAAARNAQISAAGNDGRIFFSNGGFHQLPQLASNIGTGAKRVRFSAPHGLKPGDWFIIYNPTDFSWHTARAYYRAGEWCRVAAVTAQSVTLYSPLTSNYETASVDIYHVSLRRPSISGGQWDCGQRTLADYSGCTGPLIDVGRVTARANTAININRCVAASLGCREGNNAGDGRDDYLIAIGNSQHIRVSGGVLFSRRHPVAIGGADLVCGVPNRDCRIQNTTLRNDPDTNVMCADMHGNSENCGYDNCVITGGGSMGGASPYYRRCSISARRDGTVLEATELVGGRIEIADTKMFTPAYQIGGGRGLIDLGSQNASLNHGTRMNMTVMVNNFAVDAPNLGRDEAIIRLDNNGSNVRIDMSVKNGSLRLRNPVQLVRAQLLSGRDESSSITISDISGLPPGSKAYVPVNGAYLHGYRSIRVTE